MAERPFLILQARPEDLAAEEEYAAILSRGGLSPGEVRRVRLEREAVGSLDGVAGIVLGGGPGCVTDPAAKKTAEEARIEAAVMGMLPEICARDLPFLGCCYGMGALGLHLGGVVGQGRHAEPVSLARCEATAEGRADPLLAGLPPRFDALVAHKEAVEALPPSCAALLTSPTCPVQMMRHGRHVYATQFHPEADGESFALRIEVYRDRGYVAPEDAARTIAFARTLHAPWPARILANFVTRYRRSSQ